MTLIQRFSLLSFVVLLIFGVVFGWIVSSLIEQNMLARANDITANVVSKSVRGSFVAADFINPKIGPDYDAFANRIDHLSLGPNVERIKVWNKDMVVVWADDQRMVGKRFPDNDHLARALGGEVVAELSRACQGRTRV